MTQSTAAEDLRLIAEQLREANAAIEFHKSVALDFQKLAAERQQRIAELQERLNASESQLRRSRRQELGWIPHTDVEIEALDDVFTLATTGFDEFCKQANESEKGDYSKAASSGDYSKAASSGDYSKAASSGYSSKAASSGYYSKATSSGEHGACAAVGYCAAVKGDPGNLLMASEYVRRNDGTVVPIGGKADIVDGKRLKPRCWYIVEGGEWQEVDFSDGIFARVLSTKGGVKKVKTEDGRILYVVSDEHGNSAHGKTIKAAREDLIYKAMAKFDGKLPESATGKE